MNLKINLSILLLSSTLMWAENIEVTDVEAKYSANSTVKATEALKQSLNFGFANTSGNTDTLNVNGKYDLSMTTLGYANQALKLAFDAGAFYTENDSIKDNEEYTANLGLEQFITNGWLGYASMNWLRNEFRNYDNKYAIGTGIGKELYNDGQHSLKAKLGLAYNIEDYTNDQEEEEFGSLNEYLEYNNKLNKISNLYIKLGSLQNFDDFSEDYEALVVAGLNFAVADNISLSIEQEVSYDNTPAVGFDDTDTKSIVRVGYNF